MDAMTAILTRRSVRRYLPDPVSDETVKALLKAATSAPSAGNEQPWHFIVITDRAILDEVPNFHAYSNMIKYAPLAILVCGDPLLEKYEGFWVQDCSAATQNILLSARALGLGSVWLGFYPMENRMIPMRKLLHMPDHVIPFALAVIGHTEVNQKEVDRYKEERIHTNTW